MYTSNLHARISRLCPIQSQSLKPATNYRNFTQTRHRTEEGEEILEKREFKERKFVLQAFARARHRVERECIGRALSEVCQLLSGHTQVICSCSSVNYVRVYIVVRYSFSV